MMVNQELVRDFPTAWIDAWNCNDPDRFFPRVSDNFELWAPATHGVTGESEDLLESKAALSAYWTSVRRSFPDLRFEFVTALWVRDSVTVYYKWGDRRLAAEMFFFGSDCKVCRVVTMLGNFLSLGPVQAASGMTK